MLHDVQPGVVKAPGDEAAVRVDGTARLTSKHHVEPRGFAFDPMIPFLAVRAVEVCFPLSYHDFQAPGTPDVSCPP
jgi:hypothetical protein